MTVYPVINGFPLRKAEFYKVFHEKTQQWYRALKVNEKTYCPQPNAGGYGWGFKFLGRIQGFTRCRKCSGKTWFGLDIAPNPYEVEK